MTQPPKAAAAATEERVAALEQRVTQVEAQLALAIRQFEPTAQRVAELSSAFQAANARLRGIEQRMETFEESEPPPAEERLAAIEVSLSEMGARVSKVETAGARRGRLSSRLAGIEAALERIEGGNRGTTEPPPGG